MERNRVGTDHVADCPLLSITKAALFLIVTTFILYLPLGDPYKMQWDNDFVPVCCLSELYAFIVKIMMISSDMIQCALFAIRDGFHEAKILFYSVLEKVDRKDLCRNVCCFDEWEEYVNVDKKLDFGDGDKLRPRPATCRCVKKKCRKQKFDL